LDDCQPVHDGHAQVHQHHIRLACGGLLDGFGAVLSFTDQLEISFSLQDQAQTFSDE
jgi:hypothetical protein